MGHELLDFYWGNVSNWCYSMIVYRCFENKYRCFEINVNFLFI